MNIEDELENQIKKMITKQRLDEIIDIIFNQRKHDDVYNNAISELLDTTLQVLDKFNKFEIEFDKEFNVKLSTGINYASSLELLTYHTGTCTEPANFVFARNGSLSMVTVPMSWLTDTDNEFAIYKQRYINNAIETLNKQLDELETKLTSTISSLEKIADKGYKYNKSI